jgi:hypothetical protein
MIRLEPDHDLIALLEHDPFGNPVPTFSGSCSKELDEGCRPADIGVGDGSQFAAHREVTAATYLM